MTLLKKTITTSISLYLCATAPYAQKPNDDYTRYKEAYPDQNAVYLNRTQEVTFQTKDETLEIHSIISEQLFYLENTSLNFSKRSLYYSNFYKIDNIEAYTEIPEGNGYKKKQVKEFTHSDYLNTGMIFHDDTKKIDFLFPEIQKGSKSFLKYREQIVEPRFFGKFRFVTGLPSEEARFVIQVPKNVEIGYILYAEDTSLARIQFSESKTKTGTTYTWTATKIKGLPQEANMPDSRYYAPHVLIYVKKYVSKSGKTIQVYNTTDDLHAWYASLVNQVNNEIPKQLALICDSITRNCIREEDKVKEVYYWVQNNINYIAFADGLEGFIPRSAQTTFEKRYGDCKDMSNLMVIMLKHLGIKAHHTWIGTRDIPYRYDTFPTTMCDNHMIAAYKDTKGVIQYLDATGSYLPYGIPSSFIQGKQAMIDNIDNKPYALEIVPILNPRQNLYKDSVYCTISNRSIQGRNTVWFSGYWQKYVNYQFSDIDSIKQKKSVTSFLEKGNNSYSLQTYTIHNLKERDKQVSIDAQFSVQNYAVTSGNDLYINMNLDKDLASLEYKQDRKYPYEKDFKSAYEFTVVMEIPKDYKVVYVPKNTEFKSDITSFTITYKTTPTHIHYKFTHESNFILISATEVIGLQEYMKALRSAFNETVQLTKK